MRQFKAHKTIESDAFIPYDPIYIKYKKEGNTDLRCSKPGEPLPLVGEVVTHRESHIEFRRTTNREEMSGIVTARSSHKPVRKTQETPLVLRHLRLEYMSQ